ncbi:alpha/beta hydrolase [Nonomuraea aurantiaca]|uniref:alpha/beta hydrolase n=1 Tax=Nonomuraea aurantiaca TaxID=2878562 RepID=UPI001CD9E7E7|nr:alpha/beta hydrolase [Nonomuraea aurantiaca]MCA2226512.1 alpha/beta hydrolase [Nonomuraea aurantiaca]
MRALARRAGRLLTGLAILAFSPIAGLAALAGMAMLGVPPGVFAVTGLAVFASVLFLGLLLCVPRPSPAWGRWLRALVILSVEAAVVWQVAAATLHAPPDASAPLPAVAGQREWRLATGSELAYVRLAPKRVTRPDPVVFLHGGPGTADLAGDSAFLAGLAADGYTVYAYDQLGAGRSARLADPRGYGLPRDVADLEAVRQEIGARRLILIGHDSGARLAAAYLAEHPDQVAKAVLTSPAPLDRQEAASPSPLNPSEAPLNPPETASPLASEAASLLTLTRPPSPRLLAVYTLLRADPQAAHAFAGDREVEAAYGSGYAGLAQRAAPDGLRRSLTESAVPALIVKGAHDRRAWSAAADYRAALPRAELAYVAAGSYRGKPYLNVLRAFLAGRPVRTYDGADPPPGYLGPR